MLIKLTHNDINLDYTLTRKKVKNINVRVKADGSINVSANSKISQAKINDFLILKSEFLIKAKEEFSSRPKPKNIEYISGEDFQFLGETLKIKVEKSTTEKVFIGDNSNLILHIKDVDNFQKKEQLINKFLKSQCEIIFNELSEKIYPEFKIYNIKYPTIKIKNMKSRWGSCLVQKNIITLNLQLIKYPLSCIEYVIYHEYCHFIHPNHSKDFYALQESFVPNFRELKKELSTI